MKDASVTEEQAPAGAAGPADWVRTARAVFTTLGPNVAWDEAAIDAKVQAAVDDGANVLMCFVQDEGYALWPTSIVPVAPRANGRDLVALLVERAHAAGLRFVAQWMGVHVQTVLAAHHPGWLQRDARGAAAAAMCLNSPFGGNLLRQVGEVVGRYPVDGVYFDGLYAREGGCFCHACTLQFPAVFGRALEDEAADEPQAGRSGAHWLDFSTAAGAADPDLHAFRFATVEGFMRRLRATVDASRPGVAVLLDTLGVQAGHWPNGQSLSRLRESVDAFVLECYPDQIHEPTWHAALETELVRAEGRKPVWLLRWLARDPDGDLVAVPEATVQLHAGTALAHGAQPVAVDMNVHTVDPSIRPAVRQAFGDSRTAAPLDEPVAYAAILHSASSRDVLLPAGHARQLYDPIGGAFQALTEAHLPVRFVTDEDLVGGRIPPGTRTILLPAAPHLDPMVLVAIDSFVSGGGGLVATHRSGFGSDVDRSALAELLGIRTAGVGARDGQIGTEALGGRELVTYYRVAGGHPVTKALAGRLFSFSGPYTRVLAEDGVRLGDLLDSDDAAMDGERWFGWYPGAASSSLGVARDAGRGRVVYFAAPFDTIFFRQGRPEAGQLIAAAVRWTAGSPPPVEVDAPASVDAVVRPREGGGWTVALANRATNDLYAIGPGVSLGAASSSMSAAGNAARTMRAQHPRYVVPLAGVRVRLPGGSATAARSLRYDSLAVSNIDGHDTVDLPRLDAYDVITIE